MSNSKNDIAWEKLFGKYNVLDSIKKDGFAIISAVHINEFREARLMTKFDHRKQLPKLFSDNGLSILPTSRGGYVIGNFETFLEFDSEDDLPINYIDFPIPLESLDFTDITSEATAINCAFVGGILNDFTNEEVLYPTVSGRMSSLSFDFNVNVPKGLFTISVVNSQVEIDGGFEGDSTLNIIEAKNYLATDFLIRQLYYPYKLWLNKINKVIRPIFLTYSNGIFDLREYKFLDVDHYNSIKLIKHKRYSFQKNRINIELIQKIREEIKIVHQPKAPFPQADTFARVINLCELLKESRFLSKLDITRNYDFDKRQTDYYVNAGVYLGLIEIFRTERLVCCKLTKLGISTLSTPLADRQLVFIRLILSNKVFNEALKLYLEEGTVPSKKTVIFLMEKFKVKNIQKSTIGRRASSVIGWTNWILNQVDEE